MINLNEAFSPIVKVPFGHDIYNIAGTVGARPDADGKLRTPANVEAQTQMLFDNLEERLGSLTLSLGHVRSMNVLLHDIDDYEVVSGIYVRRFREVIGPDAPMPARTMVGGLDLPPVADMPLLVEMMGTASAPPFEHLIREQQQN